MHATRAQLAADNLDWILYWEWSNGDTLSGGEPDMTDGPGGPIKVLGDPGTMPGAGAAATPTVVQLRAIAFEANDLNCLDWVSDGATIAARHRGSDDWHLFRSSANPPAVAVLEMHFLVPSQEIWRTHGSPSTPRCCLRLAATHASASCRPTGPSGAGLQVETTSWGRQVERNPS